ncbi:hypothetical protein ACFL2K_05385 [Candidatus Margulisiibacteriota bacterium]
MKVLIHIQGGNLANVYADNPGLDIELFDGDNLEAEGLPNKRIDQKFQRVTRDLQPVEGW